MGIQESFVLEALCVEPEVVPDALGGDVAGTGDEKNEAVAGVSEGLMSIFYGCADVW